MFRGMRTGTKGVMRTAAVVGAVLSVSGIVQTQASAADIGDTMEQTRRVAGSSASGCSYAAGTVTTTWISLGEVNGVPTWLGATSWSLEVDDRCTDGTRAHLQVSYTTGSTPTGVYTTPYVTVASSGTLDYAVGVPIPVAPNFRVCDYGPLTGDTRCGQLSAT